MLKNESKCQGVALVLSTKQSGMSTQLRGLLHTHNTSFNSLEKTLMLGGRDWGQEEKGTTEDEMGGWHHQLDGQEFG